MLSGTTSLRSTSDLFYRAVDKEGNSKSPERGLVGIPANGNVSRIICLRYLKGKVPA